LHVRGHLDRQPDQAHSSGMHRLLITAVAVVGIAILAAVVALLVFGRGAVVTFVEDEGPIDST
jgi:hypothetical protein